MLRLDGLVKRYGEVTALDGCSFTAERGAMLGFLGPNGAGKTTSMRAVFGLTVPDAGTVTWDDRQIGLPERLRFGYMPESRGLYPKMKADEQLAYFGTLHGMTEAAARASADHWLEVLGLAGRSGDPVEKLSHGNQQRVQLAVALVHDPELLILDEPFSGLDPLGVETMTAILRSRAAGGAAVVFSSHQLDLVEDICEDVAIINRGRVVLAGNVRKLKDAAPVRRLEIELANGAPDFVASLAGVHSVKAAGNRRLVTLDAATDIGRVMAEAQRAGSIRHFIYTSPSLSELFMQAVA
jgi:ABC-2 type transport system ATP-binding protein